MKIITALSIIILLSGCALLQPVTVEPVPSVTEADEADQVAEKPIVYTYSDLKCTGVHCCLEYAASVCRVLAVDRCDDPPPSENEANDLIPGPPVCANAVPPSTAANRFGVCMKEFFEPCTRGEHR